MSSQGWWWQRVPPVLRVVLAVAYFGIALALITVAVTPSFRSDTSDPSDAVPVSEPTNTETDPHSTDPPPTEPSLDEEEEAVALTGAQIYEASCASCHGASLQGGAGPELGAGSEAAEESDSRIIVRITDGKGTMPAFGGSLSDDQIELLLEFLRATQNE